MPPKRLMERDGHIQILGRGQNRLVHRMVDGVVAVIRVRPEEDGLKAEPGAKRISATARSTSCIGSIAIPNSRSGIGAAIGSQRL
jgi:hypothetical protein